MVCCTYTFYYLHITKPYSNAVYVINIGTVVRLLKTVAEIWKGVIYVIFWL